MISKKLLVVGELNVDLILNEITGFPAIGTEIIANSLMFTLGSSSAIMASNISVLGLETSFCGMIGDDGYGDFIIETLKSKKVDVEFLMKSRDLKTGVTVVMNYDQDRANVTYCGAMEELNINHIPWKSVKEFHHLHLSNYFLQKGIKKDITNIFQRAKNEGLTTSLDLQYDPEENWDFDYRKCLPYVDIFLPNEAEIQALTGNSNIEAAIEHLKPYTNSIVLKLGTKGSRLITKDHDIKAAPYINKTFKDAIGAGDSFNAGFIYKYLEGASPEDCLLFGNLIGSLSTTCPGGTTAFSSREDIENLTQQILNHKI